MSRTFVALSSIAALGIAAVAIPAGAQDRAGREANRAQETSRAQVEERTRARLARMDADGDGMISPEERRAAGQTMRAERAGRMFERMDSDRDGVISRAEFDAGMARAGGRGGRGKPGRGDGQLARADGPVAIDALVARRMERFDRLDADRDGMVSAQERRAGRGERRGGRRGGSEG